jgi:hypothetical protein
MEEMAAEIRRLRGENARLSIELRGAKKLLDIVRSYMDLTSLGASDWTRTDNVC